MFDALHRVRSGASVLWARRLLAVALLVAAAVVSTRTDPTAGAATRQVLVAARDLPAGSALAVDDLAAASYPLDLVPDGAVDAGFVPAGLTLAGALRRGEPLTDLGLAGSGLTGGLPAGLVATPLRLADPAVAGLLQPGDRIDLYAVGVPDGTRIASGALVLAVPAQDTDPLGDGGVVVVALTPDTAGTVLRTAYGAAIAVTLVPP